MRRSSPPSCSRRPRRRGDHAAPGRRGAGPEVLRLPLPRAVQHGGLPRDRGAGQDRGRAVQGLAAVDFPKLDRKKGNWYPAVLPLCRGSTGLCPADYFGRTMVAHLPKDVRVGVVNVSVAGCKIELFDKAKSEAYAKTAPGG